MFRRDQSSHQQNAPLVMKEATKCIKSKQNDVRITFTQRENPSIFVTQHVKWMNLKDSKLSVRTTKRLSVPSWHFMLKISLWKNKVIYNLVDAKLNSLNYAGNALKQPLSRVCQYLGIAPKEILICSAPDHQQEIASLSDKEERNKQISLLIS